MEITTKILDELRQGFVQQRDESLKNLGATEGAIQLCEYLKEQLENKPNGEGETSPQED